jgi:hypothetical protein
MQPKACANVTRFCNQGQISVSVQILIGDLNRFPNDPPESVIITSSFVGKESNCQRLEKPLSKAVTRHE